MLLVKSCRDGKSLPIMPILIRKSLKIPDHSTKGMNRVMLPETVPVYEQLMKFKLEVGRGGVSFVGDRQGDLENTFTLPSYVRTDADKILINSSKELTAIPPVSSANALSIKVSNCSTLWPSSLASTFWGISPKRRGIWAV